MTRAIALFCLHTTLLVAIPFPHQRTRTIIAYLLARVKRLEGALLDVADMDVNCGPSSSRTCEAQLCARAALEEEE